MDTEAAIGINKLHQARTRATAAQAAGDKNLPCTYLKGDIQFLINLSFNQEENN